ncbi:MAG: efflux RND transporter periplasmic adaptor subunit [Sphingobacteriaceae bacterium]|nr:efflux RND transporter periplasmic adaptor subunit [Cytophagaceae bacterium]
MAKKSSNRIWWILGVLIIVLLGGLMAAKSAGWIGQPTSTEVTFATVGTSDITERVSASGKVQPEIEVKITPDVPGEIIALNVAEGDSVTKGQLLLKIRPDNYESLLARARATVNQTKANYEQTRSAIAQTEARLVRATADFNRNKKLYADKVISDSDYETSDANFRVAKQDVESARANVEAARFNVQSAEAGLRDASENLRKTTIYAPSSGTVSKLAVEFGERVVGTSQMAGTELLRIANLNNMEVRVNVNENDIVRVSLGDTVLIDVDAYTYSGRKFKGIVTEMANTANGSGGLSAASTSTDAVTEFEVKIRILRSSYRDLIDPKNKKAFPLRPGMTASVEIITERKPGVLSVPIAAVTTRGDASGKPAAEPTEGDDNAQPTPEVAKGKTNEKPQEVVFVRNGTKVQLRKVKTGISDFENIEIREGLKKGEVVVSGPFLVVSKRLKDGELVAVKKADPKAKKE